MDNACTEGKIQETCDKDKSVWDEVKLGQDADSYSYSNAQPMMAWHQKQNMQDHLVAIQQITAALAHEDWDAVASAAGRIASSPQRQQQCEHMGSGADGFTARALDFHTRADAIAPAAASQDVQAVLAATSHTLEACTSCHATYRQDVVDAATWAERTGAMHAPSGAPH